MKIHNIPIAKIRNTPWINVRTLEETRNAARQQMDTAAWRNEDQSFKPLAVPLTLMPVGPEDNPDHYLVVRGNIRFLILTDPAYPTPKTVPAILTQPNLSEQALLDLVLDHGESTALTKSSILRSIVRWIRTNLQWQGRAYRMSDEDCIRITMKFATLVDPDLRPAPRQSDYPNTDAFIAARATYYSNIAKTKSSYFRQWAYVAALPDFWVEAAIAATAARNSSWFVTGALTAIREAISQHAIEHPHDPPFRVYPNPPIPPGVPDGSQPPPDIGAPPFQAVFEKLYRPKEPRAPSKAMTDAAFLEGLAQAFADHSTISGAIKARDLTTLTGILLPLVE